MSLGNCAGKRRIRTGLTPEERDLVNGLIMSRKQNEMLSIALHELALQVMPLPTLEEPTEELKTLEAPQPQIEAQFQDKDTQTGEDERVRMCQLAVSRLQHMLTLATVECEQLEQRAKLSELLMAAWRDEAGYVVTKNPRPKKRARRNR